CARNNWDPLFDYW
nr:immunoglobulin heavy chain junction region [Mus musculus]